MDHDHSLNISPYFDEVTMHVLMSLDEREVASRDGMN